MSRGRRKGSTSEEFGDRGLKAEASSLVDELLGTPAVAPDQRRARLSSALSVQERKLVAEVAGGATIKAAAAAVGMTRGQAGATLGREAVQSEYRRVLKAHGVDDDKIARTLKDCLDATGSLMTREGEVVTVPDYAVRLKTVQHLDRILGHMPEKATAADGQSGGSLHFHFSKLGFGSETLDKLDAALKRLEGVVPSQEPLVIDVEPQEAE